LDGRVTILLVEDDDDVRAVLSLMLEDPQRRVLIAATVSEALDYARELPVDVLLVDVVLPEMPGPRLVEQLRELRPDAHVLYISGWYDHPQFPDLGAVLQKPFTRNQLNLALAELLQRDT
jgi:DNA-binding response OmpR family regulator